MVAVYYSLCYIRDSKCSYITYTIRYEIFFINLQEVNKDMMFTVILPQLQSQRGKLTKEERLFVDVLGLPIILRLPVCTVLFLLWQAKKYLLGNYYAKKSRK